MTRFAFGETKIVEATIAEVSDKGFTLTVGTDQIMAEDAGDTHFWKGRESVKRDAFKAGDRVFARLRTDADAPLLRELADTATWVWLDKIRKQPTKGTVEKVDDKSVTLRLADGTIFKYRATAKSKVQLKAKPEGTTQDLQAGQVIWAKGRTLPTLDTWLVLATDTAPAPTATTKKGTTKGRKTKEKALPTSGSVTGTIVALVKQLKMFDALTGIKDLHITYNEETKFYLDGKLCRPEMMRQNMDFTAHYKRDKFGRLMAFKVELFSRSRT